MLFARAPCAPRKNRGAKSSLKRSGRSIKLRWAPPRRILPSPKLQSLRYLYQTVKKSGGTYSKIPSKVKFSVLYHWLFHYFFPHQHINLQVRMEFPAKNPLGRPNAFWGADASSPDTYASLVPALQRDWRHKQTRPKLGVFSEGPDGGRKLRYQSVAQRKP